MNLIYDSCHFCHQYTAHCIQKWLDTRISSENVRYVLCLRSWGILAPDDDKDEIIITGDGKIVVVLEE
jgi:hypothetical protein